MKFLFVANTHPDPSQGASGCDLQTIAALRDLGHEVDAVWTGGWKRRIPHHNLHQLLELPGWFRRIVLERCSSQTYDVVQVNQPHAWLAAQTFRQHRFPGVFMNRSHGWETRSWRAMKKWDSRPFFKQVATKILRPLLARHNHLVTRYADGIVVETGGDREAVLSERGCQKVCVLAPGIPSDFLTEQPPADPARFRRVLHAASFSPHKAPEIAAAVMRRLARQSDLELTWVTQESAHPAIAHLLGPDIQRVRLLGWLPPWRLREELDRHGFFLQPSHFEGFSLAFLQAMARGGIVLGSRIDCMVDTICDGKNGFLFSGQPDQMADTIFQLTAQPDRCLAVSHAARVIAVDMTWPKAAQKFQTFCQTLLAEKSIVL